jgi:hypothetical protein
MREVLFDLLGRPLVDDRQDLRFQHFLVERRDEFVFEASARNEDSVRL